MLALTQLTSDDQVGATGEEVTEDQAGSPEREMEVTCQPRAAAALQMRLPEICVSAGARSNEVREAYRGSHCRQQRRFSLWLLLST